MKLCPETVCGSRHGKCREISGEILLLLLPQETKLETAWNFSRQIPRHFSPTLCSCKCPDSWRFSFCRRLPLKNVCAAVQPRFVPGTNPACPWDKLGFHCVNQEKTWVCVIDRLGLSQGQTGFVSGQTGFVSVPHLQVSSGVLCMPPLVDVNQISTHPHTWRYLLPLSHL